MNKLDEIDRRIVYNRLNKWNEMEGPRVGDFIYLNNESLPRRITYNWGDRLQTTMYGNCDSSFYFGDGHMDFSGALDKAVSEYKTKIIEDKHMNGRCWIFHHDIQGAGRSVHAEVKCRVYHYND